MVTPNRGIGLRTAAAGANSPYWELLRGVTSPVPTPMVTNVSVTLASAVETNLLLTKTSSPGTPLTSFFGNLLFDPGGGGVDNTRIAVTWSAPPTIAVATQALARVTLPAVVGATVSWDFEEGELEIQQGESLLLWNIGAQAGALLDVSCFFRGN